MKMTREKIRMKNLCVCVLKFAQSGEHFCYFWITFSESYQNPEIEKDGIHNMHTGVYYEHVESE